MTVLQHMFRSLFLYMFKYMSRPTTDIPTFNDRLKLVEAHFARQDTTIFNQQIEINKLKHQAEINELRHQAEINELRHQAEINELRHQAEISRLQKELLQSQTISNPPQQAIDLVFPSMTIRILAGSSIISNLKNLLGKDYEEFRIFSPQGVYQMTHIEPIKFKSFINRLFSDDKWEYIKS